MRTKQGRTVYTSSVQFICENKYIFSREDFEWWQPEIEGETMSNIC